MKLHNLSKRYWARLVWISMLIRERLVQASLWCINMESFVTQIAGNEPKQYTSYHFCLQTLLSVRYWLLSFFTDYTTHEEDSRIDWLKWCGNKECLIIQTVLGMMTHLKFIGNNSRTDIFHQSIFFLLSKMYAVYKTKLSTWLHVTVYMLVNIKWLINIYPFLGKRKTHFILVKWQLKRWLVLPCSHFFLTLMPAIKISLSIC